MRRPAMLICASFVLISLGSCGSMPRGEGTKRSSTSETGTVAAEPRLLALSVNDALAWRVIYGDLLGKPREAVIERFGPPEEGENNRTLSWKPSPKTGDRRVHVMFGSADKDGITKAVKIFARTSESLDPMEVLKNSRMFRFRTGTYRDALVDYFAAETKDGRNVFQFDVADNGVKFRAMVFTRK